MSDDGDDEGVAKGVKLLVEGSRFVYQDKDGKVTPKTSWSASPFAYVSDPYIPNAHKMAAAARDFYPKT